MILSHTEVIAIDGFYKGMIGKIIKMRIEDGKEEYTVLFNIQANESIWIPGEYLVPTGYDREISMNLQPEYKISSFMEKIGHLIRK